MSDSAALDADHVLHLVPGDQYLIEDMARQVITSRTAPQDRTRCDRDWITEGMTHMELTAVRWRVEYRTVMEPTPVAFTTVRMTDPEGATICAECRGDALNAPPPPRGPAGHLPTLGQTEQPAVVTRAVALDAIPAGADVDIFTHPGSGHTTVRPR